VRMRIAIEWLLEGRRHRKLQGEQASRRAVDDDGGVAECHRMVH
jgi:hypothetical protein